MASSSPTENELNLLPAVYDVIRGIEKDSSPDLNQVNQKLNELKTHFQKARECVEKLPGTQYSKEEQLRRVAILNKQMELKSQLLQKYKEKSSFEKGIAGLLSTIMEDESELHPIFTHNPEEWMQYVYKKVSIVTSDGKEHEGWVYTVDPVSQNFVLVQFADDTTQMFIIINDAIRKTTILAESNPGVQEKLDALFRPKAETKYSSEELKTRKLKLKSWLEKNRLPVEVTGNEEEVLAISDALMIQPPYGVNDCYSTNEIILGRIQGLIQNMPGDQEQW